MAELSEIIETYKKKQAEDPGNAVSFMLGEFQGPLARVLDRRYVGLFMLDGYELGYDPVNRRIYHVDPDETSEMFDPVMGQYILFQKKGKHMGPETSGLADEGKRPYIQRLQIVGAEEIVDAHVRDLNELDFKNYRVLIQEANVLKMTTAPRNKTG